MTSRTLIAYALILLIVAAGAALVWWNAHQSTQRKDARRKVRLEKHYAERDAAAAGLAEAYADKRPD